MDFIGIDGKMCGKPKMYGTKLTRVNILLTPQRSPQMLLEYAAGHGSSHISYRIFSPLREAKKFYS